MLWSRGFDRTSFKIGTVTKGGVVDGCNAILDRVQGEVVDTRVNLVRRQVIGKKVKSTGCNRRVCNINLCNEST